MVRRKLSPDGFAVTAKQCRITATAGDTYLWRYHMAGRGVTYGLAAPVFEIDGTECDARPAEWRPSGRPTAMPNGCIEHRFVGPLASHPDLSLELVLRVSDSSPVVRFHYVLKSASSHRLTKREGEDRLTYLGISFANFSKVTEVRLSEFDPRVHSYTLTERPVEPKDFAHELGVIGPILVAEDGKRSLLLAYEHGATVPDTFLEFRLARDRAVSLSATKGNYWDGQALDPDHPYETIWLQCAAVSGSREDMARAYRGFVLHQMSQNHESRKPRLHYNTWNYQERNHHWRGRPYLETMNQERMLEEIEVAHRLGVEVFVVDTGWYERTGDWRVNRERFPDGLRTVIAALHSRGMKLGLWFDPTRAAVTSEIARNHPDCITSWRGEPGKAYQIWETEESHPMCLVSRYARALADELIRIHRELGITYFKWDGVGQYGCDDLRHDHGGPSNSPQERGDCFAFGLGRAMVQVAEWVREACPAALIDFDVTEAGRYVGLGWLAASRYYLVNNGPYYPEYDLPVPPDGNWNVFFWPGPARSWICRAPLDYDRWIPSVLFMAHYLTDEPQSSQLLNIASLILGQNGVWGDLPALSEEAVTYFGRLIGLWKQVRHDITESYPLRTGPTGGAPEVHEKIAQNGRGAVVIFATRPGRYTYVTYHPVVDDYWATEGIRLTRDAEHRARVEADFVDPGAQLVLFGANTEIR